MQNMNHETTAATARHTALPDTVALEGEELVIIDQTELPRRLKLLHLSERYEIFEAIKSLRVRGAPAIGVAAAIGLYIAAHRKLTQEPDITSSAMLGHIAEERDYLASSRPTAVNLFWALDRMYARAASLADESPREITAGMRAEAVRIRDEDIASCRRIAENGLSLLKPGNGILTHCNAGQLAAVRYGTALAPIHLGAERGYDFRVYTDETRPLLQGMRLSAFELSEAGRYMRQYGRLGHEAGTDRCGDRRRRPHCSKRRYGKQNRHERSCDTREILRYSLLCRRAALDL